MEQLLIIDLALAGIYTVLLVICSITQAKEQGRGEEAVIEGGKPAAVTLLSEKVISVGEALCSANLS